jgi:lipopolysaccharide assembly protein A
MRFLKTLLWILIAVAIALFSVRNWTPVSVNLWSGLVLDTSLPVVLIAAFLLGLLPTFLLHKATRWSLNRKLETAHRSLNELSTPPAPPVSTTSPTGLS